MWKQRLNEKNSTTGYRRNYHLSQGLLGYSRKYPHTSYGRHWKSCNKCSVSLTGIPRISPKGKTIQNLAKLWNSQDSESAGLEILYKLLLPFLEILKFLSTRFSVVHKEGVWVFSGIAHSMNPILTFLTNGSSEYAGGPGQILSLGVPSSCKQEILPL